MTVDYITTCNDNVMTVFRYMMNKLYQNPDNIDSNMRFVYLDHLSGQYKMLIMNGKNHKVHELKINSTDSGMESIMAPPVTKVDIGTVVRKPTTAIIDSIYGKRMYTYSLESNQIACDSSVGTNTMAGVFGKSSTSQIVPISHQPDSRMMTYSTWDDPSTTYMEFVSDVLEHNSPIIKTSMKLFIELGDVLVITIPDSSDDKEKFSEIQGAWFVSKIVNTFMPSKNSGECYQKLCLVKTKVNRKSSSPLLFFR